MPLRIKPIRNGNVGQEGLVFRDRGGVEQRAGAGAFGPVEIESRHRSRHRQSIEDLDGHRFSVRLIQAAGRFDNWCQRRMKAPGHSDIVRRSSGTPPAVTWCRRPGTRDRTADVVVDVESESVDADPEQDSGDRLRHTADRIRRIEGCRNLALEIGVAVVVSPDYGAVLQDRRGQAGHPDLFDQRLEIAFEDLEWELFLGGSLPGRSTNRPLTARARQKSRNFMNLWGSPHYMSTISGR